MNEEQGEDYLDDRISDEVARILYRDYSVDPANIPDQIFDRYPDIADDAILARYPAGAPDPLPAEPARLIAEAVATVVARQVREAEADTSTRYTVWDVPESAVTPHVLATDLTCLEAMAFRAEREEDDPQAPSGLLIYPNGQAWWEWEE